MSTLLQSHLPFAVVGSVEDIKVGNKMVKARLYPWGSVQGECTKLCLTCIMKVSQTVEVLSQMHNVELLVFQFRYKHS